MVGLDAAAVLVNFFKAVINRDGIQGRKKTPFDATAGVLINETDGTKHYRVQKQSGRTSITLSKSAQYFLQLNSPLKHRSRPLRGNKINATPTYYYLRR